MLRRNFFGFLPALLSVFHWKTPNKEILLEEGMSYKYVDEDGNINWVNHLGQLHRTDGPAVEKDNGDKHWLANGRPHRVNAPAIEKADGDKEWWVNGRPHRTDGPAIEFANGDKRWYVNGQLHRENGPAIECVNGHKEWYLNGQFKNKESVN